MAIRTAVLRAFDTLQFLASHPHELLGKQRLMQAVWPNAIVEENNLNQQISVLRKLFGEGPGDHQFIVTVTGRGFRLVQDVTRGDVARAAVEPQSPATGPAPAPRSRWGWLLGATVVVFAVLIGGVVLAPAQPQLVPLPVAASAGGTHDPRALKAYHQARVLLRNVSSLRAIEAVNRLEQAVLLDPNYAMAWAALAEAYTQAADVPPAQALPITPVELQQRISRAALRALELAPEAPQTLQSAGMVSMQNRDWAEAGRRLNRAVELAGPGDYDANFHYAWFLANVGRVSEAIPYAERAMRAEPTLMRPVAFRAALHEMQGRFDEAKALLLSATRLQGDEAMRRQGLIMIRLGNHDACGLPRAQADDGLPCPLLKNPGSTLAQARQSYADASANGGSGQLFSLAHYTAFLGDDALTLQILALWAKQPTQNLHVIWRPSFAQARQTSAFEQLVRDVKLVDYWRSTGEWGEFCRETGTTLTCSPFARVATRSSAPLRSRSAHRDSR